MLPPPKMPSLDAVKVSGSRSNTPPHRLKVQFDREGTRCPGTWRRNPAEVHLHVAAYPLLLRHISTPVPSRMPGRASITSRVKPLQSILNTALQVILLQEGHRIAFLHHSQAAIMPSIHRRDSHTLVLPGYGVERSEQVKIHTGFFRAASGWRPVPLRLQFIRQGSQKCGCEAGKATSCGRFQRRGKIAFAHLQQHPRTSTCAGTERTCCTHSLCTLFFSSCTVFGPLENIFILLRDAISGSTTWIG